MIVVYKRSSPEEINQAFDKLRTQLPAWFAANPKRRVCKVELFYGRMVSFRRKDYEAVLAKELEEALGHESKENPQ